jgi:hypothetical protein
MDAYDQNDIRDCPCEGTPVTMEELQAIWRDLRARGVLYNGMTHAALKERYGDRVYHVMGKGWYVRPESTAEFDAGYVAALRSEYMVEVIESPANDFERGWNAYATE